jgi:hypothetical protein
MRRSIFMLVAAALMLAAAATAQSPTVTKHSASWLSGANGNLFFRLSADGGQLLVNRSPLTDKEELVVVPAAGGEGVVWHTSLGRSIYDRIALSGDATTVVFGKTNETEVYMLTQPGATPALVASLAPDGDPRQLRISDDGKWIAFTAARLVESGVQSRTCANLYVAATNGSALHCITPTSVPNRWIPFDLSGDGKSVTWLDDAHQGPMIADANGANARRIAVTPGHIGNLRCDTTSSRIYFDAYDAEGIHLWRINRDGTGETKLHSTTGGRFFVARASGQVRLERFERTATPPGASWLQSGENPTKMFDLQREDIGGTSDWSADGKVLAWRTPASMGSFDTFIWRSGT